MSRMRSRPQPGQRVTGLAAIKEALSGFLALKGTIRVKHVYAMECGNIALLQGEWKLTAKGPDGKQMEMGSRTAEVVRKTARRNLALYPRPRFRERRLSRARLGAAPRFPVKTRLALKAGRLHAGVGVRTSTWARGNEGCGLEVRVGPSGSNSRSTV